MTDTRAVTREIALAAPVDAVWKALTDADELTRWFPPLARVTPGVGGRMWRAWPSGEEIEERIERWVPEEHLRTSGLTGAWDGITTDYYLTTRGGGTVLRVVSSGFGADADWDALYDAFGGGWDFELHGLRHYLEHHRGSRRLVALARGTRPMDALESWRRLVEPGGWMGARGLRDLVPGARYAATAGDHDIGGYVVLWQPPRQFAATVEQLNNAYLRIDARCIGETGTPWIWLSVYGLPDERVRQIQREWQASLDATLA
jgi:uncharacterized protein YndB with AHSA1/START domain